MVDSRIYFNRMKKEESAMSSQHTDEIDDLIDRMPSRFGLWVSLIVLFFSACFIIIGFLVKYPETVSGKIVINTRYTAVKLVAASSGKIDILGYKSKDDIKEGEYLAIIQNSIDPKDLKRTDSLLSRIDINTQEVESLYYKFPKKVSLGEIGSKYYSFLNALHSLYNYRRENFFQKRESNLKAVLFESQQLLKGNETQRDIRLRNLKLLKRFHTRDSILLSQKVISQSELDRSEISLLTGRESLQQINNQIAVYNQQINDAETELQQLQIERSEKERLMQIALIASYDELYSQVKLYEQKYVFKSPISGKVQFLKFLNNDQYIAAGEELFSVIPKDSNIFGQVTLPSTGAGKVKLGQPVVIKLDSYPYQEFGSVDGFVSSVSLISNSSHENERQVDNYLIEVSLPRGLISNYGIKLEFKHEIKGTADIIVKDRKLIERLFDNFKYIIRK